MTGMGGKDHPPGQRGGGAVAAAGVKATQDAVQPVTECEEGDEEIDDAGQGEFFPTAPQRHGQGGGEGDGEDGELLQCLDVEQVLPVPGA